MNDLLNSANPFFQTWDTPFAVPPFDRIKSEHFTPAITHGIEQHNAEITEIIVSSLPANFENTIIPLEKSGTFLSKVTATFNCVESTITTDEIDAISVAITPTLSRHNSDIYQSEGLFQKVKAVYDMRDTLATPERRLVEKYYRAFERAGAHLTEVAKAEVKAISAKISELETLFEQNCKAELKAFSLPLTTAEDREGLSAAYLEMAATAAAERGIPGSYVATLGISATEAFLTESSRRDLREIVYKAHKARGSNSNANNNTAIIEEAMQLRSRLAEIFGADSFAEFKLREAILETPAAADKFLDDLWQPARRALLRDKAIFEESARTDGITDGLKPWDWAYYADKVRTRDYAVNEQKVSEYLPLDKCIEASFFVAHKLFGLNFTEKKDIASYHPDVRTWEVTDKDGQHVALFMGDYYARNGKAGGAFMSELRGQNNLAAEYITPIVFNVCNFGKPAEGGQTLLKLDEYATLFHEFGHGLHGILSNTAYPSLHGTNVMRDFVEFPSQFYEAFATDPAVLAQFARHYQTGEAMPEELGKKIRAASTFDAGFRTGEYLISAVLDMEWHSLHASETKTVAEIEQAVTRKMNVPDFIRPRYTSTHFGHIMGGYAAGYINYAFADLPVANANEALREQGCGDLLAVGNGEKLRAVYSAGDSEHPSVLIRNLCGHDPQIQPLLRQRGLTDEAPQKPASTVSSKPPSCDLAR